MAGTTQWHSMEHEDETRDQERDLNIPGRWAWGEIGPDSRYAPGGWSWSVLQFSDDDEPAELDSGFADSETAAKDAVAQWEKEHSTMPVHNFQIETDIDGRTSALSAGPRSATGGFRTTVYMRGEGGTVETAVRITGEALASGELNLFVTPGDPAYLVSGSPFEAWPESMTIAPYTLDGGGFGFRVTGKK
jgi:hypothetical protein